MERLIGPAPTPPLPAEETVAAEALTGGGRVVRSGYAVDAVRGRGSPGWKWGDAGKCYRYTAGNEESEKAARKKALAQAAAMGEFEGTGNRDADDMSLLTPVEHRNSTLQDVNVRQRLVDLIAVPWDQEADVLWRGDVWQESFDRHAFDGIEEPRWPGRGEPGTHQG